ncbi:Predicted DNA-binding transcriptional regulator YafY, contains an HTH and WYL domains [Kaistia soli DSM 19436]|uniref:Predicted DNA-binding transcriptional regulator YafY, contains an HTH and WYL domains n=1 Tax=Kaistia soli DSM 19436 TaxID=1122133 RepID=A0A1M5LNA2_9HYPH|nr:YafY family protein [Kaistia soli]SHG66612.1 Predicted DNA-binding transcriptional regulator YafY, contains an HTH and WYL domains [Kaistia soli DSM 19436]
MARSERLLDLIQEFRRHRRPVSGQALAETLGVSLRTVYRDIATLKGQGADIEGEPGLGYVLKPGFLLPPLMFADEEIEALVLGMRFVAMRADEPLQRSAQHVLAKISGVLPEELRRALDSSTLLVAPTGSPRDRIDLAALRRAIRAEQRLALAYADADGTLSNRTIWPFALGFFDNVRVLIAWCELRDDFRHFRTDRIAGATETGERYPRRRAALMKDWKALEGKRGMLTKTDSRMG